MSSLSSRGRDALTRRQQLAAGVSVTFTRKAGGTQTLTVIPGLVTSSSTETPGRVEIAERDYLVVVADLMVAGVEYPPLVGDRFTETLNGVATTFEIENPSVNEKAVRYSSQWRAMYRCHCKRVTNG